MTRGVDTIYSADFNPSQYENATDKWIITVDPPLSINQYVLQVFYRGHMTDEMEGFYRSYYKENGEKVWMASTQFQQTEARRAFPCFDVR